MVSNFYSTHILSSLLPVYYIVILSRMYHHEKISKNEIKHVSQMVIQFLCLEYKACSILVETLPRYVASFSASIILRHSLLTIMTWGVFAIHSCMLMFAPKKHGFAILRHHDIEWFKNIDTRVPSLIKDFLVIFVSFVILSYCEWSFVFHWKGLTNWNPRRTTTLATHISGDEKFLGM